MRAGGVDGVSVARRRVWWESDGESGGESDGESDGESGREE